MPTILEKLEEHWKESQGKGVVERVASRPTFCMFACNEAELRAFRRAALTTTASSTIIGRVITGTCPIISGVMDRVTGRIGLRNV